MTYTDPKLEIVRLEQNEIVTASPGVPGDTPVGSIGDDKF